MEHVCSPALPRQQLATRQEPVRLFGSAEDPNVRRIYVKCDGSSQTVALCKLCEIFGSHCVELTSLQVLQVDEEDADIRCDLYSPRAFDFEEAGGWCQELQDFLRKASEESPRAAVEEPLHFLEQQVLEFTPDLMSVQSFEVDPVHDGFDLRYHLCLTGINQEGFVSHIYLGFLRAQFTALKADFSAVEGKATASFYLSTQDAKSEHSLRSHFGMQSIVRRDSKSAMELPFHMTRSEANFENMGLMRRDSGKQRLKDDRGNSLSSLPSDDAVQRGASMSSLPDSEGGDVGTASPSRPLRMVKNSKADSSYGNFQSMEATGPPGASALGPPLLSPSGLGGAVTPSSLSGSSGAGGVGGIGVSPSGLGGGGLSRGPRSLGGMGLSRNLLGSAGNLAALQESHEDEGDAASPSHARVGFHGGEQEAAPQAPAEQPKEKKPKAEYLQVKYPTGDEYVGAYVETPEGSGWKHGYGTYTYVPGPHANFQTYQGQWREDRKHGYGVLNYRSGGVYVGQFDGNARQGMGLHFDMHGSADRMTDWPPYRYEGQWFQDQKQGLGFEDDHSNSYYGRFHCDRHAGRGVFMGLNEQGTVVCEAHDAGSKKSLWERLQAEIEKAEPAGQADAQAICSPTLWTQREIAAFFLCLGVSRQVCTRLRQRKVESALKILDMTSAEMRRELGLASPVERLLVRQSLRRLLDADKWHSNREEQQPQQPARSSSVNSSSAVLQRHVLPFESLEIGEEISEGGYGTVYKGEMELAVERCGSSAVAVKEMLGEYRVQLQELLREAHVMAALRHENICTFVGVVSNEPEQKNYILSELMDCSLHDIVHEPGRMPFSVSVAIHIAVSICSGLLHLHSFNLVHADLKSSNILIRKGSPMVVKICDFGHAAVRTSHARHHRCGTPQWAAPEALRGEALGPNADVFSVGVLLWEMLAWSSPHRDLSLGQVLATVGWAGRTVDLARLPEVPTELRRIVRGCLRFNPSDRPRLKLLRQRLRGIQKKADARALALLTNFLG